MEEKFDGIIAKIEKCIDGWIQSFETEPLKTTVKIFIILYVVKWARRNLWQ